MTTCVSPKQPTHNHEKSVSKVVSRVVHPLEPLTHAEIRIASNTIKKTLSDGDLRFCQLNLYEPHKDLVAIWETASKKPNIPRQAFAIVLDVKTERTFEIIVELPLRAEEPRVLSMIHIVGVQPNILTTEYRACEDLLRSDPQVVAALKRRGIYDTKMVNVELWSGFFSDPKQRIANPLLYLKTDDHINPYSRPIEGMEIRVDLNKMKIVEVKELFNVPVPPPDYIAQYKDFTNERTDLKPLDIIQPEGPSFSVKGQEVNWQKWSFRVGFTETEGLVLHQIKYDDNGKVRPIIFRASCVEMVVPYGDPRHPNHLKNAFDAGEDGLGRNANSLELGCDCLGTIYYFDASLCDALGNPYTIKNAVCMHEEDNGILWKHKDWRTGATEMRRSRKLVVSFFTTISNYDYGFYWYFFQDGNIKMEAKLTGILSTSGINSDESPGGYGVMIAPNLYAPIHQHFFTVRLDMQVDGTENSVQEIDVKRPGPGEPNPHHSAFYAVANTFKKELDAVRHTSPLEGRMWKIINPNKTNRMGQTCGYKIVTTQNPIPFALDDSKIVKRAGFLKNALWVTPFDPKEKFPAGNYPFQKEIDDGLTKWTQQNRNIHNTDIVVWHTFGVTHVCRAEDWPIMPTEYCGFALKPDNFFDYNPAMDVPKPKKIDSHTTKSCCSVPASKL